EIERFEVGQYLREHGHVWREDSSNQSLEFARNRIRRDLLPQLAREWNPSIEQSLAHIADWASAEEAWWDAEINRLSAAHLVERNGAILVRGTALAKLPLAPARRLVRRAIGRVKGDLSAIDFRHVEKVFDLVGDPSGGSVSLPGLSVCRS